VALPPLKISTISSVKIAVAAMLTILLPISIVAIIVFNFFLIDFRVLAFSSSSSLICLILPTVIEVIAVSELENNADNINKMKTTNPRIYMSEVDKIVPPVIL